MCFLGKAEERESNVGLAGAAFRYRIFFPAHPPATGKKCSKR